jgi:hypothetical protein
MVAAKRHVHGGRGRKWEGGRAEMGAREGSRKGRRGGKGGEGGEGGGEVYDVAIQLYVV